MIYRRSILGFQLQSYRNLKRRLGFIDSIIEVNELAIRNLLKLKSQSEFTSYIKKLSDIHGIIVDFSKSYDVLSVKMAGSYIVKVYTEFELFLYEFNNEFNEINKSAKWEYKNNCGSKLEQSFKNVAQEFRYQDNLDFKIAEYYRYCRNMIVHTRDRNLEKKLRDEYNHLLSCKEEIIKSFNVKNAPKTIKELSFEDFVLFTKVVKRIGKRLCKYSEPNQPENIILSLDLRKFKKFINNEVRLKKCILGELMTLYSYSQDEAVSLLNCVDINEIICIL